MKLFFRFVIISVCFSSYLSASPVKPLVLQQEQTEYPLGLQVEVLGQGVFEADRPLTFQEVSSPRYDSLFKANQHSFIDFKEMHPDQWVRFKVKNSETDPSINWVLESNQWYSNLEMFIRYPDQTILRKEANTVDQEIDDSHVLLRLEIPAGQEVEVYLRMDGARHYLTIWEESAFFRYARQRDMLYSAFLGIFIIMALYNLILFFTIKDISYLYYSLYCLGFILFQITMTGFGYQHVWPRHSWVNNQWLSVLGFTTIFGILAARSFLSIRQYYAGLDRFIQLLLALCGVLFVGSLLDLPFISFSAVLGLSAFTALCLFISAILVWRKGFGPARYYLLGWTFLLVSILIYYFSVVGWIPFTLFTSHVVKISAVIEIVLLSLGLADRINVSKREEKKAHEEVIEALREKDKIKDAANRALEQKARELEQAYHALLESRGESAKLQELDQVKTRFFANISHEFRTPLTLILGQTEVFLKAPGMSEKDRQEHEVIYRNANRLLQLINQLLDLAKLEAGNLQLQAEPADVGEFLRVFVSSFASFAESKDLKLHVSTGQPLPEAYIDKDKMEKVVGNLLSNAFKFTPKGGEVSVRLSREEGTENTARGSGHVKIEVEDTGIGISEEKLEKVFDRFFQEDSSRTRTYNGTGIGLALVKELVKAMHGTIKVESERGKGTCFTILLPLGKAHLKEEEIIKPEVLLDVHAQQYLPEHSMLMDRGLGKLSGVHIEKEQPLLLVIEDNADVRSFVKTLFAADYTLLEADDGRQGLELAREHVPDIIISDLMMPEMDGFVVCRKLKTDLRTSHIPVILLTARANPESHMEGLETGADDYLVKPFKAQELQLRVQNLIEGRKRLRRIFSKELFLKPKEITVNSVDEQFLNRINEVLEENMENAAFSVECLASELNMSRSQLHRKLSALLNQSATEFMRSFRLQRAHKLLSCHFGSVADVAYKVGFNNLSYFSKCFRELYGMTPTELADRKPHATEV